MLLEKVTDLISCHVLIMSQPYRRARQPSVASSCGAVAKCQGLFPVVSMFYLFSPVLADRSVYGLRLTDKETRDRSGKSLLETAANKRRARTQAQRVPLSQWPQRLAPHVACRARCRCRAETRSHVITVP